MDRKIEGLLSIDPLGALDKIRDNYLRYYETMYALQDKRLDKEKNYEILRNNNLYKDPYCELQPEYVSSGKELKEMIKDRAFDPNLPDGFADFISKGLMSYPPYKHQVEMLQKAYCQRKNVLITSGTGSGKTESFCLPLFAYLMKDRESWKDSTYDSKWWDKPNGYDDAYQRKGETNEEHPKAIRALIMYPMNALVEDQLSRLREALDNDEIRNYLGNKRIFFGRYNSSTIAHSSIAREAQKRNAAETYKRVAEELKKMVEESRLVSKNVADAKMIAENQQSSYTERKDYSKIKDAIYTAPRFPDPSLHENDFSSEMLTRWDMQETAPDILITNYSMLNIMLMRQPEQKMFDDTRNWLEAADIQDPNKKKEARKNRIFHLIIDELHLYRGTSGTEVAYLIRMFLKRIGLEPTIVVNGKHVPNPQLRILASSASLGSGKETQNFLEQFFGVYNDDHSPAFETVSGSDFIPQDQHKEVPYGLFEMFAETDSKADTANGYCFETTKYIDNDDTYRDSIKRKFLDAVCPGMTMEEFVKEYHEQIFYDFFRETEEVCKTEDGNGCKVNSKPRDINEIIDHLLGGNKQAMRGFLIFRGDKEVNALADKYKLPRIRFHQLYKYTEGLWGELVPNTPGQPQKAIGKVFYTQEEVYNNGKETHKILELLRCENCGELYIGGNRQKIGKGRYILSLNSPNLNKIPNRNPTPMVQNKVYSDYAVFWPTTRTNEEVQASLSQDTKSYAVDVYGNYNYNQTGFKRTWVEAYLSPYDGQVIEEIDKEGDGADYIDSTIRETWIHGFLFKLKVHEKKGHSNEELMRALPCHCPACKRDYYRRKYTKSPIRSFRTGIDRTNQVLSKELFYQLDPDGKKLIGFSDSRQDAAKQAYGIGKEHYRDMVRLAVIEAIEEGDKEYEDQLNDLINACSMKNIRIFNGLLTTVTKMPESQKKQLTTEATNGRWGNVISRLNTILISLNTQVVTMNDFVGGNQLNGSVVKKLLQKGINPGGVDYCYQWYGDNLDLHWSKFYSANGFDANSPACMSTHNSKHKFDAIDIKTALEAAIYQTCFGLYMKVNTEDAGIGYVTLLIDANKNRCQQEFDDLDAYLKPTGVSLQDFMDAIIRILGDHYRYNTPDFGDPTPYKNYRDYNGSVKDYITAFTEAHNLDDNTLGQLMNCLIQKLLPNGILDFSVLGFRKTNDSDTFYRCPRCGRIHLHKGTGFCTSCGKELKPCGDGETVSDLRHKNYISYDIFEERRNPCRFHTEELTGQTDDQAERLLNFKDIILIKANESQFTENLKLSRPIDMLNVTTTMEVGVDIGSLQAVYQGNMPPTRYNYQQRVGRGGRRGQAFSLAMTFCRGKSHDIYYYTKGTDQITGGTPVAPKLSVHPAGSNGQDYNYTIVKRVIFKDLLKKAFDKVAEDLHWTIDNINTLDTHGEFGYTSEWQDCRPIVKQFFNSGKDLIMDSIDYYIGQYNVNNCLDSYKNKIYEWLTKIDGNGDSKAIRDMDTAIENAATDGTAQALAEAGLLPMYGMPSNDRLLYHGGKRKGSYPVSEEYNTVDRPLEQAISEFAPGSILVKDCGQYKSAGLTVPYNTYPVIDSRNNPSQPSTWDALRDSYVLVENGGEISDISDKRNQVNAGINGNVQLVIPRAFRTENVIGNTGRLSSNEDTRSNYTQTHIWAKTKNAGVQVPTTGTNYDCHYWNCTEENSPTVWYVNDNNQKGFQLTGCYKAYQRGNQTLTTEPIFANNLTDAVEVSIEGHEPCFIDSNADFNDNRWKRSNTEKTIYLGARKVTEMICLTVRKVPEWLNLDVNAYNGIFGPAIKAAFYSAATLIQRAFAHKEDIDPQEIEISEIKIGSNGIPMIYLSDQLQNGSGYVALLTKVNPISNKTRLQELMEDIVSADPHNEFIREVNSEEHRKECKTACPHCLKVFNNSGLHHILDWRLGMDLIKLMLDEDYKMGLENVDLQTPYMDLKDQFDTAIQEVREAHSYINISNSKGYTIFTADDDVNVIKQVLIHPLWNPLYVTKSVPDASCCDLFTILHKNYKLPTGNDQKVLLGLQQNIVNKGNINIG